MKKFLLILVSFVAVISLYAASNSISAFRAFSNGSNITVEWTTSDESNIKQFEVQRSSNNYSYSKVKVVDASGKPGDYKYVDEDALLKSGDQNPSTQSGKVYSYRLKLISPNGSEDYSEAISVTHQTNSIRRTWGMIKELFR